MDSTNFQQKHHHQQQQQHQHHHLHLQEHFVGYSPLNLPSGYGVSTSLDWNNPSILSTSETSSNTYSNKLYENEFHGGATGDSRSGNTLSSTTISPVTDVAARNLSYSAAGNQLPKIEEDMLSSFQSFSGLINSTITATSMDINPASNWFNGFASGAPYARGLFPLPLDHKDHDDQSSLHSNINNWTGHGHGFPSCTSLMGLVSSPNSTTSVTSSPNCLGLNLQAMDFLGNNAGFSSHNRSLYDVVGEEVVSPAAKIMSNKKALMNGVTGTKRAAECYTSEQPKASTSNNTSAAKKSQLKVSCPPFKVRKEKLGDRIASLHQLVSPFGKTDTASVLTEAIGYIQFLQDQIHTLCMPHAKPSRNKPCRPFQMGSRTEEEIIDLRRRGLCLVPLSWTSYITPTQMDASNPSYF